MPVTVTWVDVLSAIAVSLVLGLYVGFIYRIVAPGAMYSVSILHTLLYVSMIVSVVMMVIANEIARAFTLVGALAVIRFRTPVKDSRDAAFIFLALAAGMGAGVKLYVEAAVGVLAIGLCILLIHYSKFGLRLKGETLVRFTVPLDESQDGHNLALREEAFKNYLPDHRLINVRSLGDRGRLELTFLVKSNKKTDMVRFSQTLSSTPGVADLSVMVWEDEEVSANVL